MSDATERGVLRVVVDDWIVDYVKELRERAADREKEGSPAAAVYLRVAQELLERKAADDAREVTIREAVALSGYSVSQLRRLRGAGRRTFRKGELPRRPGHRPPGATFEMSVVGEGSLVDRMLERRLEG